MRVLQVALIALAAGGPIAVSLGYHFGNQLAVAEPRLYQGVPLEATLLALDKQALDEAYHDQLKKLFGVWLSSQAGNPAQIQSGLAIARRAYGQAAAQIEEREKQLQQKP